MNLIRFIQIVKEVIVWIDIFGVGITQYKFCSDFIDFIDKLCKPYLLIVIKGVTIVRGKRRSFRNRTIGRIQINKSFIVYAHEGDARNSESTSQSFFLNNPVILVKAGDKGDCKEEFSLLAADAANIVADTVKKAENGRGFIVRLYESANKFTRAKIVFGVPVRRAAETDLTERETNGISLSGENTIALEFRPFEIKTIFFETEKSGNAS